MSSKNALASSLGSAKFHDLGVRAILPQGERILLFKSTALTGDALVKSALQNADVVAASLNYRLYADAITPNDPRFPELWGLNNTGQTGGTAGADISAPEAWSTTTGSSGVVVADIDTGVAYDHVDLAANMWHNPGEIPGNGIDDDLNGYVDDVYGIDAVNSDSDPYDDQGHGTHTSGTAAAVGNNGIGISGVAWQARVMALKFLPASGSGTDADALTCVNYVVNEKLNHGVNVVAINASWGGRGYDALLRDAINAAAAANIVFCAAAGNGGADGIGDNNDATPQYPSSYDCANIISVAATDDNDARAVFSNYGATSVDLAAPGVGILSTIPGDPSFVILPGGPFYDTMESGSGGWTAQPPWAITTEQAVSPTHAWSDSPGGNYLNNTNAAITTPVINLSATPGPEAFGFSVKYDLEQGFDYLRVEFSNDGGATWRGMGSLTGYSGGAWVQYGVSIPADMRVTNFRARLRLETDSSMTYDGVYVDDVGFGSLGGPSAYDSSDGTSMATPHVTGAVALCAAQFPSETMAQRVQRILGHVDPIASLSGKMTTGGRLNVAAAVNAGVTAPTVTGFTPAAGPVGTSVTLTGTNFSGATKVAFHGTAATIFAVASATQITATVPSGATTGTIAVTTPAGMVASATSFTVVVRPKVTLKLSGLKSGAMKLGRRVTAKGKVTPSRLAGSKVKLTVQKKKGSKWVKVKSVKRTLSPTGAYSWKYKPAKRGAYHMRATIAKTAAHTAATTKWRKFKVK